MTKEELKAEQHRIALRMREVLNRTDMSDSDVTARWTALKKEFDELEAAKGKESL